MSSLKIKSKTQTPSGYVFRIIFVLFFVYLAGNLFFLWDGFGYYALPEFLQSAAFVSFFWGILASFISLVILILLRVIELVSLRAGLKIRLGHLFFYAISSLFFVALSWKVKKLLWHDLQTVLQVKLVVLLFAAGVSAFVTWKFHDKVERWMDVINLRTVSLFWVFCVCFALSLPVTAYQVYRQAIVIKQCNQHHNQPIVTFVIDDEADSIYTTVAPVFSAKGDTACVAMVSDYIGGDGHMTLNQLLELQNRGWEIAGHSSTHPDLTTLTNTEIEAELKVSKDIFTDLGYRITNFTYPYHKHNARVRKFARRYYRSARAGPEWTTGFAVNPHFLRMYALSSYEIENRDKLSLLKEYVDYADANDSWLIFTMHREIALRIDVLDSLIDYIHGKGIKIATINQGLDMIGNKESRLGELLLILNSETPLSGDLLSKIHVLGQHLISRFEDNIVPMAE